MQPQQDAIVESDDGRYVATVSGTDFLLDRRYESIRCVACPVCRIGLDSTACFRLVSYL